MPTKTLGERRAAMAATIADNAAATGDAATRFMLDGLSARLARLLTALDRDLERRLGGPFGTAGRWGPNGRGPEIDDLIRRSAAARRRQPDSEPRPPPARIPRPAPPSLKGSQCPALPSSNEACSTLPSSPQPRLPTLLPRP